jgi:hypothetical protein
VFRCKLAKYAEARDSPFYQVSKELAARNQVNMERARNDLKEHLLICTDPAADPLTPESLDCRNCHDGFRVDRQSVGFVTVVGMHL